MILMQWNVIGILYDVRNEFQLEQNKTKMSFTCWTRTTRPYLGVQQVLELALLEHDKAVAEEEKLIG